MKKHFLYLKYVLRHKWFVLLSTRKTGCSIWRALLHDLSKFYPSEWFAYVNYFYGAKKNKYIFNVAWLKHQHRNPHHYQYWILKNDDGTMHPLPMPNSYVKEMVSDWIGASIAINGFDNTVEWYGKNKHKMHLHSITVEKIEKLIKKPYIKICRFHHINEKECCRK